MARHSGSKTKRFFRVSACHPPALHKHGALQWEIGVSKRGPVWLCRYTLSKTKGQKRGSILVPYFGVSGGPETISGTPKTKPGAKPEIDFWAVVISPCGPHGASVCQGGPLEFQNEFCSGATTQDVTARGIPKAHTRQYRQSTRSRGIAAAEKGTTPPQAGPAAYPLPR